MRRKSPALTARAIAAQVAVVAAVVGVVAWLVHNVVENLSRRGIMTGFDFLTRAARFPISESVLEYSPVDSFARAVLVGFTNTLFIALVVIALSTVLGLLVALERRSTHPLVYGVATVYVDTARNLPLVVQLLFWYSAVTFGLPAVTDAAQPFSNVFLTDRGLYVPRFRIEQATLAWTVACVGILATVIAAAIGRRRRVVSGERNRVGLAVAAVAFIAVVVAWFASAAHLTTEIPVLGRFNYVGGLALTPEFVAILLGLTAYSTAFVAEIIRGGIAAVPRSQWEAGHALALSPRHTLQLIVIPQALRIIVPPLTSQYINILKNSTLALVVGYPDLNFVIATTINQTGQALEGILILIAAFVLISVGASLLMNWFNRRIALPQR